MANERENIELLNKNLKNIYFLHISLCHTPKKNVITFLAMVTLTSKANATKRIAVVPHSDDAVMRAMYHLIDICLQF